MLPGPNGYDIPLQEERYQALHYKNHLFSPSLSFLDVNGTNWFDYIQEFVSLETRNGQKEDLETDLIEALEKELDHMERIKSFGRASQYNRTKDDSPERNHSIKQF